MISPRLAVLTRSGAAAGADVADGTEASFSCACGGVRAWRGVRWGEGSCARAKGGMCAKAACGADIRRR
eukprot:3211431-Prymnesium_polylepis.1